VSYCNETNLTYVNIEEKFCDRNVLAGCGGHGIEIHDTRVLVNFSQNDFLVKDYRMIEEELNVSSPCDENNVFIFQFDHFSTLKG
jgi:hypothetical protein